MTQAIAVDASVAVKWVVLEPLTAQARAVVADSLAARRPLIAPPHFTGEAVNAIHQRWRSNDPGKHLTHDEADAALTGFLQFQVEQRGPTGLYLAAVALARAAGLASIYDALYVAFAQIEGAELWTADARLVREVGIHAPWVKALAAYPMPGTSSSML